MLMAIVALGTFAYALYETDIGLQGARTLVFTILVWTQLFQAGIWRSELKTQIELGLLTNKPLIAAIILSLALQTVIVAFEPLHEVFAVENLRPHEWFAVLVVSLLPVPLLEWMKKR
jgi:Ca2+-transporting ATPase